MLHIPCSLSVVLINFLSASLVFWSEVVFHFVFFFTWSLTGHRILSWQVFIDVTYLSSGSCCFYPEFNHYYFCLLSKCIMSFSLAAFFPQHFDFDVFMCGFLCINTACNFLNFLKLWVNVFHWFWKIRLHYFYRYCCCIFLFLSFYGTLSTYILGHWTTSHVSLILCFVFPFFVFLCASVWIISTDISLLCPVCHEHIQSLLNFWLYFSTQVCPFGFLSLISLLKFCIFHSFCSFFTSFL